MSVNDSQNWNVQDPAPGVQLHDIVPISRRALGLLARNQGKPILQAGFLNVHGAIKILEGLDYHHGRFVSVIDQLATGRSHDESPIEHEAVAYINRLGQFHYFTRSALVRGVVADAIATIPTIDRLVIFRNKVSAHRSIDWPRLPEDTPHLQEVHALALMGRLFLPKAANAGHPPPRPWRTHYLAFQINMGTPDAIDLVIERDHATIMNEAYALLVRVLA